MNIVYFVHPLLATFSCLLLEHKLGSFVSAYFALWSPTFVRHRFGKCSESTTTMVRACSDSSPNSFWPTRVCSCGKAREHRWTTSVDSSGTSSVHCGSVWSWTQPAANQRKLRGRSSWRTGVDRKCARPRTQTCDEKRASRPGSRM